MYMIMRRQGTVYNTTGWTVVFRSENAVEAKATAMAHYNDEMHILVKLA